MQKNKIFCSIILFLFSIIPAFSVENADTNAIEPDAIDFEQVDEEVENAIQNSTEEVVTPQVKDIQEMTPNANDEVKKQVLNDTNKTLNFTIKKFLCAMIGVVISSIIVFLILFLMNKTEYFKKFSAQKKEEDFQVNQDEIGAPSSENEALKVFFEKTR